MGYSQHSGMVIVADGTDAAAKRLARVLVNDCGSGVMRHADAGYETAIATAQASRPQSADDQVAATCRSIASTCASLAATPVEERRRQHAEIACVRKARASTISTGASASRRSQSGPFSVFAGIDRTLALVDGGGVLLDFGGERFVLGENDPLIEFPGEAAVHATVTDGVTTDFNVMTRRGRCRHRLERAHRARRR